MNFAKSGPLKELLEKNECVWMKVVGKSMLPFLKSGTLIAVRKADIKDIYIGDIVLFKRDDITIAHRVVKKANQDGRFLLWAKSDLSFASGAPINCEELMGKVVAFKRFGREIKIDNFIFCLLGLGVSILFPFIARAHFAFKTVVNYAVKS